jgi:hypothetical protein
VVKFYDIVRDNTIELTQIRFDELLIAMRVRERKLALASRIMDLDATAEEKLKFIAMVLRATKDDVGDVDRAITNWQDATAR